MTEQLIYVVVQGKINFDFFSNSIEVYRSYTKIKEFLHFFFIYVYISTKFITNTCSFFSLYLICSKNFRIFGSMFQE